MRRFWLRLAVLSVAALCIDARAEVPDKSLPISAKIPRNGDFLGWGFNSIWMMSGARLARVNPADNTVLDIPITGSMGHPRGFQIGEDAVWLADVAASRIFKIDPTTNALAKSVAVPMVRGDGSIGAGLGSVWVVADGIDRKLLLRLDSDTGAELAHINLPSDGSGVIVAFSSVWVTSPAANVLYRIDPEASLVAQTISLASTPRFLTADEHSIWVLDQGGYVQKVDGRTGDVQATIETGIVEEGGDIDAGGGYVWITFLRLALMQIDPRTDTIVARYHAHDIGDAVRYGAGSVWISGAYIHRVALP